MGELYSPKIRLHASFLHWQPVAPQPASLSLKTALGTLKRWRQDGVFEKGNYEATPSAGPQQKPPASFKTETKQVSGTESNETGSGKISAAGDRGTI
jgi:hypothetical protein